MTTAMNQESLDFLIFAMKEDSNAVNLCLDLLFVGHLWDDLIDGDVKREPEEINSAFLKALGEIPLNPVYIANQFQLAPMMLNVSLLWLASNDLEKGNDDNRFTAFMIRNGLLTIIHYIMVLVGGFQWARDRSAEFWRVFGLTLEKYQEFVEEKKDA
jgi:hypothetical protein